MSIERNKNCTTFQHDYKQFNKDINKGAAFNNSRLLANIGRAGYWRITHVNLIGATENTVFAVGAQKAVLLRIMG